VNQDKEIDQLQRLARAQSNPPRSSKDLAVLEAARTHAAIERQRTAQPGKGGFLSKWLGKPMWLGAGSAIASVVAIFLVVGHPIDSTEPGPSTGSTTEKAASVALPAAQPVSESAPISAPVSAPVAAPVAVIPPPLVSSKKLPALAKVEVTPAREAPSDKKEVAPPEIAERALSRSADVAAAPALSPPSAPASAPLQSSVPSAMPSPAAAAAPSPVATASRAASLAIKSSREALTANATPDPNTCLTEMRAVPEALRDSQVLATRRAVDACVRKFPNHVWPDDLQWIKRIVPLEARTDSKE
jgi:hypothetical protein